MKKFGIFVLVLLLSGCWKSPAEEVVSELSNTIAVQENSDTFFLLSADFAQQLEDFDLSFGDFATHADFFGIVLTGVPEIAEVGIRQDGIDTLKAFEFRLPEGVTYEEAIGQIGKVFDLQQAAFGPDSFYFLEGELTTNIVLVGDSLIALQMPVGNFETVRDFISAL